MAKAQLKLASSKTPPKATAKASTKKAPDPEPEETQDEAQGDDEDEGGGDADGDESSTVIVQSKVKEAIKAGEMNCGGDFVPALNAKVHELIRDAIKRCDANGRKTVRPQDL